MIGCNNNAPVTQTASILTNEGISFKNTVISLTFDDGDADNYAVRSVVLESVMSRPIIGRDMIYNLYLLEL